MSNRSRILLPILLTLCILPTACKSDGSVRMPGDDSDGGSETCSDFSNQSSAQRAYNNGNKDLDGDGDGKACEHLS